MNKEELDKINQVRRDHYYLHNTGSLFYTLTPQLLIAIARTFRIQDANLLTGDFAYYEFGLFKGFSFWFAEQLSRDFTKPNFKCYGFDSFNGLPKVYEDKNVPEWTEGSYNASLDMVNTFLTLYDSSFERIELFKGIYSKDFFKSLEDRKTFKFASVCVIDCDLYESCVPVLDFVGKYFRKGTIVIMDDYDTNCKGEREALSEYEARHPEFRKEILFKYNPTGMVLQVTKTGGD